MTDDVYFGRHNSVSALFCKWRAVGSNRLLAAILPALFLFASSAQAAFLNDGWDWEARRWQTNIVTSGGTISGHSYMTGTRFMNQVKQWGVRPRLGRVNLYLGNQTNAMLCPIIHDWFSTADGVDDLIAFAAADYSEATGLTGNTSTKYLRPNAANGINLSSFSNGTNIHMANYVRTGSNEDSICMGAAYAGTGTYCMKVSGGGSTFLFMGLVTPSVTDTNGKGFYMSTRTSSTNGVTYKNGASLLSSASSETGSIGSGAPMVHAINSAGSIVGETSRALSYYAFGLSISSAQSLPYYIAVRNVQVALGRNVE